MFFTLIKRFIEAVLLVLYLFVSGILGTVTYAASLDYNELTNWAYWEQGTEKSTDCFLPNHKGPHISHFPAWFYCKKGRIPMRFAGIQIVRRKHCPHEYMRFCGLQIRIWTDTRI